MICAASNLLFLMSVSSMTDSHPNRGIKKGAGHPRTYCPLTHEFGATNSVAGERWS
jgi:hypothetical protein